MGGGELHFYKLIFEKVEKKNPVVWRGLTPLHLAAKRGNFTICRFIIENVTNKSPITTIKKTPLFLAKSKGHVDVCRLFEENNWIENPSDKKGRTGNFQNLMQKIFFQAQMIATIP